MAPTTLPQPRFRALQTDTLTLHLISDDNLAAVCDLFRPYPDADLMLTEIAESYRPTYLAGQRTTYGFYARLHGELAGLSLLSIDDWPSRIGSTGADTLQHMRGRGVAPGSKPHLFYLAFALLGLNRVETGCFVSNTASQRSIEKTPGFVFEGIRRESGRNDQGAFEDERCYAILRRDWLRLYDQHLVRVLL